MQRKIRVLVGKPGLDGHDRGAKVVAAALRDAGMEVIYTGLHQTSEQIVEAAVQEDVDVVALSILSGAHMTLFPEVLRLMRERGVSDKLLTGGGIIPPEDMDALARMGVGRLFGPGSSTQDIVAYVREWFASRHGADSLTPLPEAPARPIELVAGPSPAPSRAARAARAAEVRHHAPKRRPAAARAGTKPSRRARATAAAPRGPARRTKPRRRAGGASRTKKRR